MKLSAHAQNNCTRLCVQRRHNHAFSVTSAVLSKSKSYECSVLEKKPRKRTKPLQLKAIEQELKGEVYTLGSAHIPQDTSGITASGGYRVSKDDRDHFRMLGYVHLPAVLTEEDMKREIDPVYERFLRGEIYVPGADLCDMSGAKDRVPEEFTVYNVMLPRIYCPEWQGNLYERRCQEIADQLQGGDMVPDYDQILAKRPNSEDAVFAWHQDLAYWPPFLSEKATATCWLAVSDASIESGCMRFVPRSHREMELRPHAPVAGTRADSHALYTVLKATDPQAYIPVSRGDITVHNEQVVHGSGPNRSSNWRKAYVLAFRKSACVAEERSYGFTHSHNDDFNWDNWIKQ